MLAAIDDARWPRARDASRTSPRHTSTTGMIRGHRALARVRRRPCRPRRRHSRARGRSAPCTRGSGRHRPAVVAVVQRALTIVAAVQRSPDARSCAKTKLSHPHRLNPVVQRPTGSIRGAPSSCAGQIHREGLRGRRDDDLALPSPPGNTRRGETVEVVVVGTIAEPPGVMTAPGRA